MPDRPCRLGATAAASPASACSRSRSVGVFSLAPPRPIPCPGRAEPGPPDFTSASWTGSDGRAAGFGAPPAAPAPAAFSSASISSGLRRSSAMTLPSLLHDPNFADDDFLDVRLGHDVVQLAFQLALHEIELRIAQILDA